MGPRVVSVAIPFRVVTSSDGAAAVELLMCSSRKHPHRWIFPKGGWEEKLGETLMGAAVREAGEEAGIVAGPVDLDIAPFYAVVDAAKKTAYSFFSLPVASLAPDWLEKDERRREFVSIDEAGRRLEAWVVKTKGELAEGLRIWVEWWEREGKTEYRPRKSTGEALSSSDTSL